MRKRSKVKGQRLKQEIQPPKKSSRTPGKVDYPVSDIKKSLKKIEAEVIKFKRLTQGIPGAEKNITPILSFIDILKFHLGDLEKK